MKPAVNDAAGKTPAKSIRSALNECAANPPWLGSRRQDCPSTPAGRWGQCLVPRCCRPGHSDFPSRAGMRLKQKNKNRVRFYWRVGGWRGVIHLGPWVAFSGRTACPCAWVCPCLAEKVPADCWLDRRGVRASEREREATLRCVLDRPDWICDV